MTPEDLDRILASEEPLVPSSGFVAAVMEQVHEAAAAPPPLPFPWRRFLLGLSAVFVLTGLCGWRLASLPVTEALQAGFASALTALAEPRVSLALGAPLASLAGTYLLVRLILGVTGARR